MIIAKNIKNTRRAIAFTLISLGIFAVIMNKLISSNFCISCIPSKELNIFLIFLFVEIIFIVCGASLLILESYPPEI
jgi:hypothetical protein|tara:strand:+ start:560 stop:790 length:231 start_codon:yes stop_codon:yes gene_type:complete